VVILVAGLVNAVVFAVEVIGPVPVDLDRYWAYHLRREHERTHHQHEYALTYRLINTLTQDEPQPFR
jgi:hypothetical protein